MPPASRDTSDMNGPLTLRFRLAEEPDWCLLPPVASPITWQEHPPLR